MNWGKVFYIFFALMSLTTSVAFIFEHSAHFLLRQALTSSLVF